MVFELDLYPRQAMFHYNVHPQVFFAMGFVRAVHANQLLLLSAFLQMSSEASEVLVGFAAVAALERADF